MNWSELEAIAARRDAEDERWRAENPPPTGAQCRCTECSCRRVDPNLDDRTSALVVCESCCLGRHIYPRHKHDFRCECGKRLA